MSEIFVKEIPQDNWYHKSFNVLVPLEIQGKMGILLKNPERPTMKKGSVAATIRVNQNIYHVPSWAYELTGCVV